MSSRVISRRIVEAYAFLIYVKKYFLKKKKNFIPEDTSF